MTKKLPFAAMIMVFTFAAMNAFAQRPASDPKHENHYSAEPVSNKVFTIEFIDAHSQQQFTHVKLKITNKTSDFLVLDRSKIQFKYPDGKVFTPEKGGMFAGERTIIEPQKTETITLKVTSPGYNFHAEKIAVAINGFERVSTQGKEQTTPDFQLPAANNDFDAGNFHCDLDKLKKETKETSASFKCKYTGDKVAIIDPSKLAVKTKEGTEYANDNRKDKEKLVFPGETEKVTCVFHIPGKITDMQFATMFIVWKNTFSEVNPVTVPAAEVQFVLDPGMTEAKNR